MAEKQLAYRASDKEEFFADDDPLSELARIVGFEPRPAAPAAPVAQRQEPAFDLEDELLREFERYDSPRAAPADDDVPLSFDDASYDDGAPYADPVNSNDPNHTRQQPEAPAFEPQPQSQSFAAPEQQLPVETYEQSWQQPEAYSEPAPVEPAYAAPSHNEAQPSYVEAPPASPAGARDLIEELEMSIGAPVPTPTPVPGRGTPQWAAASIRLPLANFNVAKRIETPAPVVETAPAAPEAAELVEPVVAVEEAPVVDTLEAPEVTFTGFPSEQDRHEIAEPVETQDVSTDLVEAAQEEPAFDLIAAARDGDVHADAALSEPPYEAKSVEAFGIDDLLDDVQRYPVPQRDRAAEYPIEQKPAAFVEAEQPTFEPAVPIAPTPTPAPVTAAVEPVAAQQIEMSDEDPFGDQDFDFDLESIELELADFDFTEPKAPAPQPAPLAPQAAAIAPQVAAVVAPAVAAAMTAAVRPAAAEPARAAFEDSFVPPQPRTPPAPRPELAARPAEAPILQAPRQLMQQSMPAQAPVAPAPQPYQAAAPILDADQPLPFDPSEISETDDRVETFEGTHVPTLPPIEKEEPVAASPEYDFDIDAEMASLFGTPAKDVAEPAKSPVPAAAANVSWARATATVTPAATAASVAAPAAAAAPMDGLDEFERALEEDFRRSVREAEPAVERVQRMTIEPSMVIADRQRVRSMRGMAVAAVGLLVIAGGAYGGYKWLGHGGTALLASGEPRVITADKDPVKVVPQNPGGKVVPNQDKAVYDRVAGDVATAPKQKELVSSDEQPMDVVQKTLIPDASPDDSDGGGDPSVSTPVGETEDPRLLPNQAGDNATATASDSQDDGQSVAPRKVRTMIVKPDGTLVARDDDGSQSAVTPAKQPATGMNAPAVNQIASANPVTPASDAANAESTPIRVVKTTKVADAGIPAAGTPLATSAPAVAAPTPVQAAPSAADATPVPAARPQAAKPAAHPAPAEVASASPKTQPVQAAPAASAGAGGYVVQIASLPSEADAKKSQANLSSKFGSVIGGHPIEIKKFDIAGKGTYYRVRVVAGSKDAAADLCVKYRAAGGTCLISK